MGRIMMERLMRGGEGREADDMPGNALCLQLSSITTA